MNLEESIKKLSGHQKKELVATSPVYLNYMDDEDILTIMDLSISMNFDPRDPFMTQLKSTGRLKSPQIVKKIIEKRPGIMKDFDSLSGEFPEDDRKDVLNYYIHLRFPDRPGNLDDH